MATLQIYENLGEFGELVVGGWWLVVGAGCLTELGVVYVDQTVRTLMSHHDSLTANREAFKSEAAAYDAKETIQAFSDMFAMSLLEFDVAAPRISAQDSEREWDAPLAAKKKAAFPGPNDLHRRLIHKDSRIIDFACGTGLVAGKLAPYIAEGHYVGIDISAAMLERFDAVAARAREEYPKLDMSSVCGDVLSDDFDASSLTASADVVICTLGFHHFHEYARIAEKLKTFVRPGGWIFIYDLYNEDNDLEPGHSEPGHSEPGNTGAGDTARVSTDAAAAGVSRHGLSLGEMARCLAGFDHVSSVREFRAKVWEVRRFIDSHCRAEVRELLELLPRRGDLYQIGVSMVLAVGQRPSQASRRL